MNDRMKAEIKVTGHEPITPSERERINVHKKEKHTQKDEFEQIIVGQGRFL